MHLTDDRSARIFVAGHAGLVGRAVTARLRAAGYGEIITRSREQLDLRRQAAVERFFAEERPQFVVLAAARVGGIEANRQRPADFLYDNLAIELAVLRAAAETESVRRVVFLGSSCIYPREAAQPMREDALLTGPLEPTNQWYAVAKIAGVKLCQALRRQHGADFVSLMPTNLYGPGDNFDLETSHVAPALLRKFHEAAHHNSESHGSADRSVTLWGTGTPRRELLFHEDLADAILFVFRQPEDALYAAAPGGLLNVGSGQEVSIRELAEVVRGVVGAEGVAIEHDRSRPDGTPRKLLDTSRMQALGWQAGTPLEEGLRRTYAWYREHEDAIRREEAGARETERERAAALAE